MLPSATLENKSLPREKYDKAATIQEKVKILKATKNKGIFPTIKEQMYGLSLAIKRFQKSKIDILKVPEITVILEFYTQLDYNLIDGRHSGSVS